MPALPVTAIVPLKGLAGVKQRLAPQLSPSLRRELAAWMLAHVVEVCRAAPSVADLVVVAGDEDAAALAHRCGVRALLERRPGIDAALARADDELSAAAATLVVTADLPLLTSEEVEHVVRAGQRPRSVVIAPTWDGGTGGLLRHPPGVMGTAYGPGSAAAHRVLAAEAGVLAVEVTTPGFAHDVDTAGQLREAGRRDPRLSRWAG